jgi:hypothetical protein
VARYPDSTIPDGNVTLAERWYWIMSEYKLLVQRSKTYVYGEPLHSSSAKVRALGVLRTTNTSPFCFRQADT